MAHSLDLSFSTKCPYSPDPHARVSDELKKHVHDGTISVASQREVGSTAVAIIEVLIEFDRLLEVVVDDRRRALRTSFREPLACAY
jgi:hypothetical protein